MVQVMKSLEGRYVTYCMLEDECIKIYERRYWPPDVELQGGSSIADAAVCKDRLNDEL